MLKIGWILISIINGVVFNLIILNYKVSKIHSYLYGFVFILLSILFIETDNIWPLLISTLCIILAYGEIIPLNRFDNQKGRILRSGFFIGLIGVIFLIIKNINEGVVKIFGMNIERGLVIYIFVCFLLAFGF